VGGQIWVVGGVIVAERQRVTGCRLSPYDAARHSRDISAHIRTDEMSHMIRNNECDKMREGSRRGHIRKVQGAVSWKDGGRCRVRVGHRWACDPYQSLSATMEMANMQLASRYARPTIKYSSR
jgi:hypothetical protein